MNFIFSNSRKSYPRQLLEALALTKNVSGVIRNDAPGIYNFLCLTTDLHDIIPYIKIEWLDPKRYEVDIEELRLYPEICRIIINIREDLRSIIDFLDVDVEESEADLVQLEKLLEPDDKINLQYIQAEFVLTEWHYDKRKDNVKPSEDEKRILDCVNDYILYSAEKVDDLKSVFIRYALQFEKATDEILQALVPIDKLLLRRYNKTKKSQEKEIGNTLDSLVSKKKGKIHLCKEDYEDYYFKYLQDLQDSARRYPVDSHIYKAHVVAKPLCITDHSIKKYLFGEGAVSEMDFIRLIKRLIEINYLKEKCGIEIQESEGSDTSLSDADKALLKGIFAYAAKVDWQKKATLEKANMFFEEIFKEQAFRDFFKKGRGKENARAEVAMAYVLGYLMQKQLIGGTQKNISKKVFGKDMSNSINKAYRDSDDARQAYKDLKPTLEKYRKKYF